MTKKKNTRQRNLPIGGMKNNSRSRKIFKSEKSGQLCIREYDFSTIEGLSPVESYENIITMCVCCMVMVALLCQLRALRPDGNSSKLDQLPSYRLWKKRGILGNCGSALATALASCLPQSIVLLPDDPIELQQYLQAVLGSYDGNEPFIEKASERNIGEFLTDHMSRILGLLNACPSSNMGTFHIDCSVLEWGIQDVIDRLPLPDMKKVTVDQVREILLLELDYPKDTRMNFTEKPFEGTFAFEGICKIEKELFGDLMSLRQINDSTVPLDEIEVDEESLSVLTPLERRSYLAALSISKKSTIVKYTRIMKECRDAQSTSSEPEEAEKSDKQIKSSSKK